MSTTPRVPGWLQDALADPAVTDLCLNGPQHAFVDRGQGLQRALPGASDEAPWTEGAFREWVLALLARAGRTWDARHPFVDGTTPEGHRLHAVFPPVAGTQILISLRRLPRAPADAPDGGRRWAGAPGYANLAAAVRRGESLILCGATGSGKTTLLQELLDEVPASERIIALEDTPELAPRHPHFLTLQARAPNADGFGEVTLRTLLKQTLRMRPDRVILGECRGAEVLELLQALNTGHRGALATLHASSAREALRRLELLCLLHGGGALPLAALRELLALGLQWLVHVERRGPERRIREVLRVEGREGDTILLRPVVHLEE